ncbi:hypothetical protein HYFRA_00011919 [Hymenoscyphus fraxineus]|uniref:ER transporter 6TM N-terminal domain-containing protein n=1 Tax=Hymenoscyphus fraxineus TaxID=746836 RepID=A0A9N9L1S1_9HELO|nr:hypothetical protein HYFRA_00011919 [Hymenoscyphus fraxineus]
MEEIRMVREQSQSDTSQQEIGATVSSDEAENGVGSPNAPSGHSNGEKLGEVKSSDQNEEAPQNKVSMFKKAWAKSGLNLQILKVMFKGSVAPMIGIAFYEADSVVDTFGTLGYLVAIIAVLCFPIMPRAKYTQTLVLNTLAICVGSAVALFGIWTGVKARENTVAPGSTAIYNSSQSVVCAIWLFFNTYFINYLRAKLPALTMPVIMYGIFSQIAFTYGPLFSRITQGMDLIGRLLASFLTAFALSTGVHLFIFPSSSRKVVFGELEGYFGAVRGALRAQTAYVQSLESSDMFAPVVGADKGKTKKWFYKKKGDSKDKPSITQSPQAAGLKGAIEGLKGLHGRLYGDIKFAKREAAWGKLDANDLDDIFKLLRGILIPLVGLSTIVDIFQRTAERRGWVPPTEPENQETEQWQETEHSEKEEEKRVWNEMMKALHEPFAIVVDAMDEGLQHAAILLEITTPPKKKKTDIEKSQSEGPRPGELEFGKHLESRVSDFYSRRGQALKTWARENGLSEEQFDAMNVPPTTEDYSLPEEVRHHRDQQQLYIILYLEFLLYSVGLAITNLIRFAEKKVGDGTMQKNRLILPGQKRLKKWIKSVGKEGSTVNTESPNAIGMDTNNIYLGAGFGSRKDPEHLPPTTRWQRLGTHLRIIPSVLGSTESSFGFRVSCATMSVAIVAYLKNSYVFFMEQRLVWAMFIIAIGMSPTSGQSTFGFIARSVGTGVAMVTSLIIWYIVNGKTPGVIVFLWLFTFVENYFFLKYPRHTALWLICIITQILIVGYELQVNKIGKEAAAAGGQPYLPIYIYAPYRLATVIGGSFVAYFWTIFPYAITDKSELRRDLGSTLNILANYHAIIYATTRARMDGTEGNMELETAPGKKLEHVRHKTFGKLLNTPKGRNGNPLLEESFQGQVSYSLNSEFHVNQFQKTYENIILRAKKPISPENRRWINDLSKAVSSLSPTSHILTTTLSLLSASITQGRPLPPYLQPPPVVDLAKRLETLDRGILDARHIEEPGYASYAVMQVASSLVIDDFVKLVDAVKELVGEADFTFMLDADGKEGKRD